MTPAPSCTLHSAPAGRPEGGPWIAVAASFVWLAGLAGCGDSFGAGDEGAGGGTTATTVSTGTTSTDTTTTATNPVSPIGCADEEPEGLAGLEDIAACAGGFGVQGLASEPACSRGGGDDGFNDTGDGCAAADLCAQGWHVCASLGEVADRLVGAEDCSLLEDGFFATLVTTTTAGVCEEGALGGVAGCGIGVGLLPADSACTPLTAVMTYAFCDSSEPWICESTDPLTSARKQRSDGGGVLCCR